MTREQFIYGLKSCGFTVRHGEICYEHNDLVKCFEDLGLLEPTTKNDLGVDWDELKRKILMEVDGGTDDKWLGYADVCENISNSIDEFVADNREVKE